MRERAASLAPTIAYQFTVSSIICRWHIWYLLRNDPAILREAFHSQFRKLVTAPAFIRSYVQCPMVVVIDGLDECKSAQDRVSLLNLILEASNTKSIRFLIASRPEEEIEAFFKHPDVSPHVDHVVLDEESFKTSKDIINFLRFEFARIRQSRPHCIPLPIDGEEWPGNAVIGRLAVDSDGQFIYAVLAIGYIDTPFFSPPEQLQSLLNPPPATTAFSKLDCLYLQILTRRPPHEQGDAKFIHYQRTVKGILQVMIAWPFRPSIQKIASVLGEDVHVVQAIVRGPLRTLFKFWESYPGIAFCHKSLGDCLLDPHRSAEFHVPNNALDLLYLNILSRPLPSLPSFTREQLTAALLTLALWADPTSNVHSKSMKMAKIDKLALISGIDATVIRNITQHEPTCLLFEVVEDQYIEFFHSSLPEFVLDRQRSGEIHVPSNALDLLYLRVLSLPPIKNSGWRIFEDRPWPIYPIERTTLFPKSNVIPVLESSPPDPPWTFSPHHLVAVLRTIVVWPNFERAGSSSERWQALVLGKKRLPSRTRHASGMNSADDLDVETISLVIDAHPNIVPNVVWYGPSSFLFTGSLAFGTINRLNDSVCSFLMDPRRSGKYHVPENALDLLFLGVLSRPPPVECQDHLLQIFHALTLDERHELLSRGVRTGCAVPVHLVEALVSCPQKVLFAIEYGDIPPGRLTLNIDFIDSSFWTFLSDPRRSGRFYFSKTSRPDLVALWNERRG